MIQNSKLIRAKKCKNDEFYTLYSDIESELIYYKPYFKGKTIYCNCDNPYKSNFTRYFLDNMIPFGINKLICTHLAPDGCKSIKLVAVPVNCGDLTEVRCEYSELIGNGDYRSDECLDLLKRADIIVTNPPFSLFREYVSLLDEYHKDYLILGNLNAVTYKEVFQLIKGNRMWLGVNPKEGSRKGNSLTFVSEDGEKKQISSWWFTNLDHGKKNRLLQLTRNYNREIYPNYDNYNAIEVSRTKDIPIDYEGIMGVPISYLGVHDPSRFEILGLCKRGGGATEFRTRVYSKSEYPNANDLNGSPALNINGEIISCYARILIKRKN